MVSHRRPQERAAAVKLALKTNNSIKPIRFMNSLKRERRAKARERERESESRRERYVTELAGRAEASGGHIVAVTRHQAS